MPVIALETLIHAPVERVFDLARSIDAHQDTTAATGERAVAGVISGLIGLGQSVTWEARHLGVRQRLSVTITRFERPRYFQDVMTRGAFKSMVHDHTFVADGAVTRMTDHFVFSAPLGPLGWIAEKLFLEAYMRAFIERRNLLLKDMAESETWKSYLDR